MNVATIQVPKAEAESKLREYRRRVHAKADSEYARIREAYEAAASGKPLLVLSQVMEQSPRDQRGRPMLAVARADRRQVRVTASTNFDTFSVAFRWGGNQPKRDAEIAVARPLPPELTNYRSVMVQKNGGEKAASYWHGVNAEGFSLIPITPPDVARGHDLSRRFVLWEVEQWADQVIDSRPDRDPYLLERLGDDLYAVVGEWDLTPLEQAIMRDRARN